MTRCDQLQFFFSCLFPTTTPPPPSPPNLGARLLHGGRGEPGEPPAEEGLPDEHEQLPVRQGPPRHGGGVRVHPALLHAEGAGPGPARLQGDQALLRLLHLRRRGAGQAGRDGEVSKGRRGRKNPTNIASVHLVMGCPNARAGV